MCVFRQVFCAGEPAFGGSVQHCWQTAGLEPKSLAARHCSSIATGHPRPRSAEMSTGGDTPQPATALNTVVVSGCSLLFTSKIAFWVPNEEKKKKRGPREASGVRILFSHSRVAVGPLQKQTLDLWL